MCKVKPYRILKHFFFLSQGRVTEKGRNRDLLVHSTNDDSDWSWVRPNSEAPSCSSTWVPGSQVFEPSSAPLPGILIGSWIEAE